MRNFFILAAACLTFAAQAQEVQKIVPNPTLAQGIAYALPTTVVKVEVTAKCTTTKAGRYAAYAEKLLAFKDVPTQDQVTWSIEKIELSVVGAKDTSRVFTMDVSKDQPTVYLSAEGVLWSINREPDYLEETIADDPSVSLNDEVQTPAPIMTEEMLKAGSVARQAEAAASQIFRIRESRMSLLTGDSESRPTDGKGYQLVLDQLQSQEAAYTALFKGEESVRYVKRTYQLLPKAESSKGQPVFRFSQRFGLVDADDLSGKPYRLTLKVLEDNRVAPVVTGKREKGVVYLLPGKAHVAVTHNGKPVVEGDFLMAQFGREVQLPKSYFIGKRAGKATFNPVNGSMKTYEQQ